MGKIQELTRDVISDDAVKFTRWWCCATLWCVSGTATLWLIRHTAPSCGHVLGPGGRGGLVSSNSPPSRRCPRSRVCREGCRRLAASKRTLRQEKNLLTFWLDSEILLYFFLEVSRSLLTYVVEPRTQVWKSNKNQVMFWYRQINFWFQWEPDFNQRATKNLLYSQAAFLERLRNFQAGHQRLTFLCGAFMFFMEFSSRTFQNLDPYRRWGLPAERCPVWWQGKGPGCLLVWSHRRFRQQYQGRRLPFWKRDPDSSQNTWTSCVITLEAKDLGQSS